LKSANAYQKKFKNVKLPYGVQYEIARYVSTGHLKFSDLIFSDVDELASHKTNEKAAPALHNLVKKKAREKAEEPTEPGEDDNQKGVF